MTVSGFSIVVARVMAAGALLPLFLLSRCVVIPHPEKADFGGEDACFVSDDNNAVGVADGVGGWMAQDRGSDSAKYSKGLMEFSRLYSGLDTPLEILSRAWDDVDHTMKGSTTAIVAKVVNRTLLTLNIGDSGCGVYRNFEHVFHTDEVLWGWNFPQQLGMNSDVTPKDGVKQEFELEANDIIVCGSDGVWDNLYRPEVGKILKETFGDGQIWPDSFVESASKKIAADSAEAGADRERNSPFADGVKKTGREWNGGKLDDVTVVVSLVREGVVWK
jgi:protein phosphatase PTC7